MTRIIYAAYEDPEVAERALGELLEAGIAPEDLSLVAMAYGSSAMERRHAMRMLDSGQAHPDELRLGPPAIQAEGVPGLESEVGGGISTIAPEDNVSYPEELDDAADIAENLAEPLKPRWYGLDEEEDARKFAELGSIEQSQPTGLSFGSNPPRKPAVKPNGQISLQVLGGLLIMGDGSFATSLLSSEITKPGVAPADVVMRCLYRQGVAPDAAIRLSEGVESGGAVIATTETPIKMPIQALESMIEQTGAGSLSTFVLVED